MRSLLPGGLLALGLAFIVSAHVVAAEPSAVAEDEQIVRSAHVGVDGPSLLDFFRKRTIKDAERDQLQRLIQQLGDSEFAEREKASHAILERGPVVMKQLSEALSDPDAEVVRRAQECLDILERAADPSVAAAAARLLAERKPEGAAEVLLAYIAFTNDEMVVDEVRSALARVALRDGKPEKVLEQGLTDKLPVRRAAAAEALAQAGLAELQPTMHKLLQDPDATVRTWVALGLLHARDREAVPVLIRLLTELPRERAWGVEDVLCRLAGEKAPNIALGNDDAERRKCRDTWAQWWADNGAKVDLASLDLTQRMLGYTLIVQMDLRGGVNGRVMEIDRDGKVRWQIENLRYAIDAQVVGADRVLITEYTGRCVTERNFKGEILWQKQFDGSFFPLNAQRLPNGNTFIACRNLLTEVDRSGKEVFSIQRNNHDVMSAQKLRNGQIVMMTNTGNLVRLDAAGKEVNTFQVGPVMIFGGGGDALANGHVMMPSYQTSKVIEYDAAGKSVWEAAVTNPSYASRLPNGHVLVVSFPTQQVLELDQSGKEVWQYKGDGRMFKARRR